MTAESANQENVPGHQTLSIVEGGSGDETTLWGLLGGCKCIRRVNIRNLKQCPL